MLRFLACILLPSIILASLTFTSVDRKLTLTVPTMDYFELEVPSYNLTQCIMVPIQPSDNLTDCSFAPAAPLRNFNLTGDYLLDYKCTVGVLDLRDATDVAGCHNIAETALGLKRSWLPSLDAVQFPSNKVMLAIILPRRIPGLLGGPVTTPYLSHDFGTPDGAPAIDTAFVVYEDAVSLVTRFRLLPEVEVSLDQEIGPWNEFFLSTGYIVYKWLLFAVNCLMVIYSFYLLFLASVNGTLKLDQRTVIFVGGIISAIAFAVGQTFRRQTQLFYLIEIISSFFFSIAFYLLVSLWSGLLSHGQQRTYSPLKIAIYIGMLVATVNLVISLIWITIWGGTALRDAHEIMRYVVPVSQALVGFLFLFYAIRFQIRMNDQNASAYTKRALTKLAWLAVLGFVTFIVKAITNFIGGDETVAGSVGGVAAVYIATDVAATARAFAVLMVLGVKLPENRGGSQTGSTTTGGTNTLMSWGGWSRGWKRAIYGSTAGESGMTSTVNGGMSQTASGLTSTTGYNSTKNSRASKLGNQKGVTTPMQEVSVHAGKK